MHELPCHASLIVTTDVYMQAISPQKREALSRLACENGHEKDCFGLTGPNWTMKQTVDSAKVLYFVGVPDGI